MRWWLLVPAVVALAARLITGAQPIDDAYITFRYARNLGEGLGLVYNPGEWVLGTTAPLWAILLGSGYRLGLTDVPWFAVGLSAVFDAGSAALLAWLSVRIGLSVRGAVLVGLAWAINPMSITFAAGGMEASLFVLLALGALSLAASRRAILAALIAGVSVFVRPEGALLCAVIVGWTWWTARRLVLPAMAAAGAPVIAGGLVLLARYGSPLPNSVAAKQVAYQAPQPFENAFALLFQAGLPGWSTFQLAALPPSTSLAIATFGFATLAFLIWRGVRRLAAERAPWPPFAAFAACYLLFFIVAGARGVRMFPWYLVPVEPFYLLGAAAGLTYVGRLSRGWLPALLLAWQLPAIDWQQPFASVGFGQERETVLLEAGRSLGASVPATAVVAAPEIGALGYASNLRILDTVGLVSPEALRYYPLPREQLVVDNAIPTRLILDERPEWVVTLEAFAERTLDADATFRRDYRVERVYPAWVWPSTQLVVYKRIDGAASAR